MIQFTRLRINGFKSFVDRTELEIGPGLTGVVGPNGCGKSNLVEALRWVMGENSAKRMRGDGMEDVIFNGTSERTKRNIADVTLLLNNTTRTAPAAYNNLDEIEVTRRIERDQGSAYKINGKNARARDVQMLFADTVTGANSPALVSQGRVTQMINAKPLDRRLILEESAGISGLFARRHEAELRLRAADTNLLRVEDILGSMEGRLAALKRQARQATRYKNVSTQIRQMEILIAYMEWQALAEKLANTRKIFEQAESDVAERLATVTQLTKTQTTQSQDLPALRQKEAEAAAILQNQKITLQRLEDESGRIGQLIAETKTQLEQTENDHKHETQGLEESQQILTRLEEEHAKIIAEQNAEDGQLEEKDAARAALEEKVTTLEDRYNTLMQSTAEIKAKKEALEQRISSNTQRLEALRERHVKAENELTVLLKAQPVEPENLGHEIPALEKTITDTQGKIEANQGEQEALNKALESARESLTTLESKKAEFSTEISLLENFLQDVSKDSYDPVLNSITPDQGFEKALSRALGDGLLASLDEQATTLWLASKRKPESLPALPQGTTSLLPHVKAPKAMQMALSQIGIVKVEAEGDALWQELSPGQSLVSKDGTYWRWDGYCIKAAAIDRHAQHLEQKNKLQELIKKRPQIEMLALQARKTFEQKLLGQEAAMTKQKQLQADKRKHEERLAELRSIREEFQQKYAKSAAEVSRLQESVRLALESIQETEKALEKDREDQAAYAAGSDDDKAGQLEKLRESLAESRQGLSAAIRAYDLYVQQQNTRKARLRAMADERINIQNRTIRAREQIKNLAERQVVLNEKLVDLKNQPDDFAEDKAKILEKISELEQSRTKAAEKLAEVENAVAETNKALKEAEAVLGSAREARAHAQATQTAIDEQQVHLRSAIIEKFEMPPEELAQHSAIDTDKQPDSLESLKHKREQLTRERDNIGPVNLQADDEAMVLDKEVTTLLNERNDLVQAIEELRSGIQKINKEARERLLNAFEHVNAHFQSLFIRLFGGGKAHLALIDSDDPLGAGLEIFAQPPGKTLQSLSLLSGGEQTLASIALIFAMFLTNPSPICVLDEIDAPLDDSNVDRVCDLLEDIAARGETRFLIITHHRLTMARMDRLYGVTMAERGVSQLVSVDLQQSFDFLEEAA